MIMKTQMKMLPRLSSQKKRKKAVHFAGTMAAFFLNGFTIFIFPVVDDLFSFSFSSSSQSYYSLQPVHAAGVITGLNAADEGGSSSASRPDKQNKAGDQTSSPARGSSSSSKKLPGSIFTRPSKGRTTITESRHDADKKLRKKQKAASSSTTSSATSKRTTSTCTAFSTTPAGNKILKNYNQTFRSALCVASLQTPYQNARWDRRPLGGLNRCGHDAKLMSLLFKEKKFQAVKKVVGYAQTKKMFVKRVKSRPALRREDALMKMMRWLKAGAKRKKALFVLYMSGHGFAASECYHQPHLKGAVMFAPDDRRKKTYANASFLTFEDIYEIWTLAQETFFLTETQKKNHKLLVIADACYSGKLVAQLKKLPAAKQQKLNVAIQSAGDARQRAWESGRKHRGFFFHNGELTSYLVARNFLTKGRNKWKNGTKTRSENQNTFLKRQKQKMKQRSGCKRGGGRSASTTSSGMNKKSKKATERCNRKKVNMVQGRRGIVRWSSVNARGQFPDYYATWNRESTKEGPITDFEEYLPGIEEKNCVGLYIGKTRPVMPNL
ncbi:unnamed protein product [Amoebophrya sp. A120]|nr:unnamed protein product [Amoebophrya sp. A120]|eukprot:GSA120T00020512001.1